LPRRLPLDVARNLPLDLERQRLVRDLCVLLKIQHTHTPDCTPDPVLIACTRVKTNRLLVALHQNLAHATSRQPKPAPQLCRIVEFCPTRIQRARCRLASPCARRRHHNASSSLPSAATVSIDQPPLPSRERATCSGVRTPRSR